MKLSRSSYAYSIPWNLFLITLGALLFATGLKSIAIPHGFITGGISGLGLLLYYAISKMSPGVWFILINIPIFIFGWVFVSRGEIQASDPELLKFEPGSGKVRLYESLHHHKNWLECIQSRQRCICDVEIGHRSVSICHIGNISMRLGRPLKWDPAKEEFVGDVEANAMLSRPMRAPWHL